MKQERRRQPAKAKQCVSQRMMKQRAVQAQITKHQRLTESNRGNSNESQKRRNQTQGKRSDHREREHVTPSGIQETYRSTAGAKHRGRAVGSAQRQTPVHLAMNRYNEARKT